MRERDRCVRERETGERERQVCEREGEGETGETGSKERGKVKKW